MERPLPARRSRLFPPDLPKGLLTNTLLLLGAVFGAAMMVSFLMRGLLSVGLGVIVWAGAFQLAISALVVAALSQHRHDRFGYANLATAIRAAIVSLVTATVFFAETLHGPTSLVWTLVTLVLIALLLDGVDGYLARRFGQDSELGARFDMEIDALLILTLSVAGLMLGKAGAWILLIGLMRYGFILAQLFLPRLRAALPPSFRRKLICVVQVGALCLLLLPMVVPPVSGAIAAGALALLAYSFAVDTLYLLRRPAG